MNCANTHYWSLIPSRPALDITVDPRLAASIDWDIYFITNRHQEEQILIRNFRDEIEATNARKVLNMIFYSHELKAMIAELHGQEVRIRETNKKCYQYVKSLLRTEDNNSTSPNKAAEISNKRTHCNSSKLWSWIVDESP